MKPFSVVLVSAACWAMGCGNTPPPPAVATPGASESDQPPAVSKPVLSNCVLHAGQAKTTERREKTPGGGFTPSQLIEATCSYSAECGVRRGEDNPGDGFANLSCAKGHCSCRLEPSFPVGAAVVEWQFDAVCTSADQAQQLLRDECLKGIDVVE